MVTSSECAPGTDWVDCDPCGSYSEDGECDTPGGGSFWEACEAGSDFIDCNKQIAESCGWLPLCKHYKTEHACERNEYRGCDWEERSTTSRRRSSPASRASLHHGRRQLSLGDCEYDEDVSSIAEENAYLWPYLLFPPVCHVDSLAVAAQDDTTLPRNFRPKGKGYYASAGVIAHKFPYQVAACGLTLLSLVVFAVVRRHRTVTPAEEHSPLATEEESDGLTAPVAAEEEQDGPEADERESVSERKALTGLV